ncbi:MAG: hypothetical protein IRY86_13220 [Thermorudis peleae]|nr:hypothetical protein [Thermorudis peleae]
MRILLIEDEARLAVMVQQSLRKQGYAVSVATACRSVLPGCRLAYPSRIPA